MKSGKGERKRGQSGKGAEKGGAEKGGAEKGGAEKGGAEKGGAEGRKGVRTIFRADKIVLTPFFFPFFPAFDRCRNAS